MAYTTLVDTGQLEKHLSSWRLFDCRHDLARPQLGEQQYREAHLPGALFAHLDRDLSAPKTGGSGARAARVWWMRRWAGHEAVAVLDGGLAKWLQEGRPTTREVPRFAHSSYPVRPPAARAVHANPLHPP